MLKVDKAEIKQDLTYDGITMVTVSITYPVVSGDNKAAVKRINSFYEHAAKCLFRKTCKNLLPAAIDEYKQSLTGEFPFRPYDFTADFETTLLNERFFSLYRDNYVYTGGAHGNTERVSETWITSSGWLVMLCSFFSKNVNYKRLLTRNAIEIAERQIKDGTHQYFDNFPQLIRRYFSSSRYYLVENGIAIYYGQYEIAPYVEGIPVFVYDCEV